MHCIAEHGYFTRQRPFKDTLLVYSIKGMRSFHLLRKTYHSYCKGIDYYTLPAICTVKFHFYKFVEVKMQLFPLCFVNDCRQVFGYGHGFQRRYICPTSITNWHVTHKGFYTAKYQPFNLPQNFLRAFDTKTKFQHLPGIKSSKKETPDKLHLGLLINLNYSQRKKKQKRK